MHHGAFGGIQSGASSVRTRVRLRRRLSRVEHLLEHVKQINQVRRQDGRVVGLPRLIHDTSRLS